jgi:hypothetical protein
MVTDNTAVACVLDIEEAGSSDEKDGEDVREGPITLRLSEDIRNNNYTERPINAAFHIALDDFVGCGYDISDEAVD